MKTPEDEAFEDIERRQGGGFPAKRQMAADKLWDKPSVAFDEWWNGDNDESTNPYRLESGAYWAWAGWKAALAQPAQDGKCGLCEEEQPFTGVCGGGKENPIALCFTPPAAQPAQELKREWVGLTDEELADYLGNEYHNMTTSELRFFRLGEAAAKEKNT
jgi:hypothetical protein